MLDRFHAAKCDEYCIEKYLQGSGIVCGVNVVDKVLNGINHKRSFKGYLILANAVEIWDAFLEISDINQFDGFSDAIKSLQIAFASKHFEGTKLSYETCSSRRELIKQEFGKLSSICSEKSEICKHWCGVLILISLLNSCVAAVREGNWEPMQCNFHSMQ